MKTFIVFLKQELDVKGRGTNMDPRQNVKEGEDNERRKYYYYRELKIQCWINPSGYSQEQKWHLGNKVSGEEDKPEVLLQNQEKRSSCIQTGSEGGLAGKKGSAAWGSRA